MLQGEAKSGVTTHKELRGALPIGSRLLGYELAAVLGQGSFGITYHARDPKLARDVAIKEYLPTALALREGVTTVVPRSTELAEDFTWGRERFLEEARTLAKLDGTPAVVRVLDFLEANGTAYMIMALVRGETLEWRIRKDGTLAPSAVKRLLPPLLDGLQCVHEMGFLHRDIKPANIMLDGKGQPTLIDFGAARAAMAAHSATMTAIFSPGYAAAEQFTSGKQGPWTDIYGLSATLYHAITGETPPNAIDRMLDDTYRSLIKRAPPGFPRGLLAGVDAGLAVQPIDRPQGISSWRPILAQTTAPEEEAGTVAVGQPSVPPSPTAAPASPATEKRRPLSWVGAGVVALALLAGGGYFALKEILPASQQATVDKPVDGAKLASEAQRLRDEQELAELRAEAETRLKANQEAAQRREVADEARRKAEADLTAKQRQEEEARQKAAAEAATTRKIEEDAKKAAEAAENNLQLTSLDRQHVQVALAALGFDTGRTDGVFVGRTREQIAAWQKSHGYRDTGFLTGEQIRELLRDAAPAILRFDKQNDEAKQQSEAQARERAQLEAKELAHQLQVELARVGCDPGTPDGVWGQASQQAMQRYNQAARTRLDATAPTAAALADVRTHTSRVCPLTCGTGYKVDGDKCVAIAPAASPADKRDAPQSVDSPPRAPPAGPPTAPNKTTALRPDAGVGGRWVDNWGAVYSITQAGDRYHFTASGQACRGPYTSQGTGVITGQRVEISYRSTYSVGRCTGTISADGNRMTSDCWDSVCGPFRTTAERR